MEARRAGWWVILTVVVAAGCAGAAAGDQGRTGQSHVRAGGTSAVPTRETSSTGPTVAAPTTTPPATVGAQVADPAPVVPAPPPAPSVPSVSVVAVAHGSATMSDVRPCSSISSQSVVRGELEARRTGPTNVALVVDYSVSGVAGDFAALPGRVTIPAGSASAAIPVVPSFANGPAPMHVHRSSGVTVTVRDAAAYDPGPASHATINLRFDLDLFGCPPGP